MYEATLHIRGNVAYEAATSQTDTSIELWCNDHCDLLHVRGETNGQVRESVESTGGIQATLEQDGEQIIVTARCLRPEIDDNIEQYLARYGCLSLPPLRYENGGKVVRVLALDPDDLTALYRDLEESFQVTVRSKREVDAFDEERPILSMNSLLPDLSARQEEAVVAAWEAGYYDIPRAVTTEELAGTMDIDRRTYEEHLRIAENKLIGTLVEELLL
jgi:predicted DNA binding protein